ncbi:hypothetical protein GLOIN_2v1774275 [Rhizophagus irregularis DAOM 181602=DAOM 197198]|nr:hypothetical protein GLOIN_2v1774275 [Rhizophagus irregularis DAOM 181602=DAOM 197198]
MKLKLFFLKKVAIFYQLNVLESIHILHCHSLNSDFVQQIIKIIKPFKLRSLKLNIDNFNVYLLIENIGQTINYITNGLNDFDPNCQYLSKIILQNLGQVLPSKLKYLHLDLLFSTDDFKMFLIDFQNTLLRNF